MIPLTQGADHNGNTGRSPGKTKVDVKMWREDYGARFSVFDPDDQPAPELEGWQQGMWELSDFRPDNQ